jgi:hypothetical protein
MSGGRAPKRKFMLFQNTYAIHPDKCERGSFRKMIGNVVLDQKKEVLQKKIKIWLQIQGQSTCNAILKP